MSRFRKWLIRLLGGYTRQIRLEVTEELRPIHTLTAAMEYNLMPCTLEAPSPNIGAEPHERLKKIIARKLADEMLERNLIEFENRRHELKLDYVLEGRVLIVPPKD